MDRPGMLVLRTDHRSRLRYHSSTASHPTPPPRLPSATQRLHSAAAGQQTDRCIGHDPSTPRASVCLAGEWMATDDQRVLHAGGHVGTDLELDFDG